jgi:hypothetical protein
VLYRETHVLLDELSQTRRAASIWSQSQLCLFSRPEHQCEMDAVFIAICADSAPIFLDDENCGYRMAEWCVKPCAEEPQ